MDEKKSEKYVQKILDQNSQNMVLCNLFYDQHQYIKQTVKQRLDYQYMQSGAPHSGQDHVGRNL